MSNSPLPASDSVKKNMTDELRVTKRWLFAVICVISWYRPWPHLSASASIETRARMQGIRHEVVPARAPIRQPPTHLLLWGWSVHHVVITLFLPLFFFSFPLPPFVFFSCFFFFSSSSILILMQQKCYPESSSIHRIIHQTHLFLLFVCIRPIIFLSTVSL